MSNNRSQEIKVGIVTLIALITVVGIIIWGKSAGLGVANKNIRLFFPNSSGLEKGAPITVHGVRCGSVSNISLLSNGVNVDGIINSDVKICSNAKASVQMLELTGGRKIELDPGTNGALIKETDVITGATQPDISAALAKVEDIANDARKIIIRLDTTIGSINGIVASADFRKSVLTTVANAEKASVQVNDLVAENKINIKKLLDELKGTAAQLSKTIDNIAPKADQLITNANSTITNVNGNINQLSEAANTTLKQVNESIEKVNSLIDNTNKIVDGIEKKEGLVGKLIFDKKLANDIENTLKETKELVSKIKKYGINTNVSIGQKP